jgi:hypothetical protein
LINIPVPPIVLYEKEFNFYEVIDGQQRITALRNFYENRLKLTGLELWPELNGRTYATLPAKIKAGIDRRSISSIVLITESASNPEEALLLKQLAFERLNTGGVELSRQEVRNCLYYGKFNELLLDLTTNSIFTEAWGIPINKPEELVENNLYKKMEDAELVLRFFALRHVEDFRRGMQGFLDLYMIKSMKLSDEDTELILGTLIQDIPKVIEWRVYDHCAVVTRLYAIYERFVEDLVRDWLVLLPGLFSRYSELEETIRNTSQIGVERLLLDLRKNRYKHLSIEEVIRGLFHGATDETEYELLPDAFLFHEQNLRKDDHCRN